MPDDQPQHGDGLVLAVAWVAARLTHASTWSEAAPDVLERLARETGASSAWVYERVGEADGPVLCSSTGWSASPGPASPLLGERCRFDRAFDRWAGILAAGGVVASSLVRLPVAERDRIAATADLGALVVAPIAGRIGSWGALVVGFEDEREPRPGEIASLMAAADLIGAAVVRDEQARLLRDAERRHRAHIEAIPAITYIENVDPEETGGYGEVYVSPQIESMLGYTQETWLEDGGHWQRAIHPDDYQRVWDEGERTNATGEPFLEEYRVRTAWGEWRWIHDESRLVHDEDGKPMFWHGLLTDITARKEAEAQVAFLAYHDPLTGLANRALFEEMTEAALARARRTGTAVALLFMDLDGFKRINDSLGHHAGDELLKGIAERFEPLTRDTDVVARQGGDEFLVLISDLPIHDGERFGAVSTARMMTDRILAALEEPFEIAGTQITASMSIGSGIYPVDASDMRTLLKRADHAMYERKRSASRRLDLEPREMTG